MDTKDSVFDFLKNSSEVDYCDGGLFFAFSRNSLPHFIAGNSFVDLEIVIFCRKGSCSMKLNGKRVEAYAESLTVCLENVVITDFLPSADFECDIYGLSWSIIDSTPAFSVIVWALAHFLSKNPVIKYDADGMRNLKVYIEQIKQAIQSPKTFFKRELVVSIAHSALYDFTRDVWDKLNTDCYVPEEKHQILRDFFDLLAKGHGRFHMVKDVAQKLCISSRCLSKIVKDLTGRRAIYYINEYTIKNIILKLRDSRITIKEIASDAGYSDIASFSKFVKSQTGKTPSEYRDHLRMEILSKEQL